MKKLFAGILLAISIFAAGVAAPTFAAGSGTAVSPAHTTTTPFTGTFAGTVYGDFGSSAPLTLELVQKGNTVEGTAVIDSGLEVNAGGFCGTAVVPATTATAEGTINSRQPRHLSANIPFEVGGMTITAQITGDLSTDGEELDVNVKIDTPFLCGHDPEITGTLTTVNSQQLTVNS